MAKRNSYLIQYILVGVLAIAIVVILFYMIPNRYNLNAEVSYDPSDEIIKSPLAGYAAAADNPAAAEETSLVFIELTWAEWEPTRGVYDTAYLESHFNLKQWQAEGKHAVLRFVCDLPGTDEHADLPDWLLRQIDGTYYSNSCGQGYSPDYEDSYLIERHTLAVAALADYFNDSDFLSYVELGSIGHWGEWHCTDSAGASLMPSASVCWRYILAYTDSFEDVRFLMRRSYVFASEGELGLYNDVFGDESATDEWLGWIKNGGSQETADTAIELVPMADSYLKSPVGGEITSGVDKDTLYLNDLSTLLHQISSSHATFLGPNIPDAESYENAYNSILKRLGARIYVSHLQTSFDFGGSQLKVEMTWENNGSAPLYWDWPVTMYVFDSEGNRIYWETLDISLSQLGPDDTIVTTATVPYSETIRSGYQIGILATDYDRDETMEFAIELDDYVYIDDALIIYTYTG